ncbi:hypothetical protein TNCV_1545641 [Trichonephila clavipes]|nr:hypothetical protein TNCV_1545641 [Trichonephila clavipes]
MTAGRCLLFRGEQCHTHNLLQVPIAELAERWTELPQVSDIIKMGRTILLERRQNESVGRRNSRTIFLRSDWPWPFARREVGVEMELGRSENKRPEQRRS